MKWVVRVILGVAMVVAAVAVSGCMSTEAADPAALEGSWVLESFGGVDELEPADTAVTTELTMASDTASGNGGVNNFNGGYEASAGTLKFGALAATAMAGPEAAMQQETRFFEALENTRHFEIAAGKLVLSDAGNNTLAVLTPK